MKIKSVAVSHRDTNGNFMGTANVTEAVWNRDERRYVQKDRTWPNTVIGHWSDRDSYFHIYEYENGGLCKLGKVKADKMTFL